jgi:hypothetical protein
MLDVADLAARVRRLEELARGLGREMQLWKTDAGPLLALERKQYLGLVQDGIAGLDAARVVLVRALDRISRQGGAP